jgi:hypothetical protein
MATTYSLPEDAVILVGSSASPTTELEGMTSYTDSRTRQKTEIAVFQNPTKISNFGPRAVSLSFEGLYSQDDPGQAFLKAAEANATAVYVKLLPNGTDGEEGYYLVGTRTIPADAENRPKVTFELALEGSIAITVIGGGL